MTRKRRDFNLFNAPENMPPKKDKSQQPRVSDIEYIEAFDTSASSALAHTQNIRTRATPKPVAPPTHKNYARHTFIIRPEDLIALQKVVHTIKSTGNYTYTQKEALHDAIQLLTKRVIKQYGTLKQP